MSSWLTDFPTATLAAQSHGPRRGQLVGPSLVSTVSTEHPRYHEVKSDGLNVFIRSLRQQERVQQLKESQKYPFFFLITLRLISLGRRNASLEKERVEELGAETEIQVVRVRLEPRSSARNKRVIHQGNREIMRRENMLV